MLFLISFLPEKYAHGLERVKNIQPTFERTFTDEEIEKMAKEIDLSLTLKEIEKKFNISYRQAILVRDCATSLLKIHYCG